MMITEKVEMRLMYKKISMMKMRMTLGNMDVVKMSLKLKERNIMTMVTMN